LLGATDRASRLAERLAACFVDGRAPAQVEHTTAAMVGQRAFGIALGYDDLVDHDQLRHEPVPAILAGKLETKRKGCAPLAGKSTLNRLEHTPVGPSRYHKMGHDAAAIEGLFVDLFLEAHPTPTKGDRPRPRCDGDLIPSVRMPLARRNGPKPQNPHIAIPAKGNVFG
jgi:hypothetical protein